MKKQLITAAIAATMSVAVSTAFADISIKGDAHFRYANIDADASSPVGKALMGAVKSNSTGQRVRLHVTGKSGNTTVKLGLRNDGATRVSGGALSDGERPEGSGRGAANGAFNTDYLFLVTKIGPVTIKAGDWWDTTGLGLARKGRPNVDQVKATIKVAGWDLSAETGAGDSDVTLTASGKVAAFSVDVEHNTGAVNTATDTETITATAAKDKNSYTDIAVKGKVGGVGIAAEYFKGGLEDSDANVVHLWTKASGIVWHIARAEWDANVNNITGENSKFSPLGVSILGSAPGVNGNLAIGNVNSGNKKIIGTALPVVTTGQGEVFGIRADLKLAGMGVQVAVGNLELSANAAGAPVAKNGSFDDDFKDIIVTRSLGKGSNLKLSWGEWNDITSAGAKISVKF